MNLLSAYQRQRIERHLAAAVARHPRTNGLCGLLETLDRFVRTGGKRLRPQLCLWTRENASAGRACDDSALLDVACGWELFHLFLLAHDDLIDNADTRRGRPSLHRSLEPSAPRPAAAPHGHGRPPAESVGRHLALVGGDLLFSLAMGLFHEADLPPATYRRVLCLFSRVAATTGLGQAIDICQTHADPDLVREETLLREYHWKTAAYTFEGPMVSGAILAGLEGAAVDCISRFALCLGQAYQMHNDLLDLATAAHEGCDLMQGKRTITLLRARRQMSRRQREAFDRHLAELPNLNGQALSVAEELRRQVLDTDALAQTRQMIEGFLAQSREAGADTAVPAPLRDALEGLVDSIKLHYFADAPALA